MSVLVTTCDARAEKISFIRDAEIERTLRVYSSRVFEVAGLDPSAIEIYIVNDNSINAFVAGGQKLFINSGLLMRSENADQVIGVIAHEAGHIAGGHLSRTHDQLAKSSAQAIIGAVLGGVAAIGGRGDLATALVLGGQQVGQRSFLQYSRTQEYAADQAGMRFMDDAGISSEGLKDFIEILGDQELLSTSSQAPYVRTHPLSRERVDAIGEHVRTSPVTRGKLPPEYAEMHARMRAKLRAYLNPGTLLRYYPLTDQSLVARYAQAVAYYRRADLDKAVTLIDGLIAERPDDPFFHELKGQMLFEHGNIPDALPQYEKAVNLYPQSALLKTDLARIQIESGDPALLEPAIGHLRVSAVTDSDRVLVWYLLAKAYGLNGDMGMSAMAMAERAFLKGNQKEARYHAEKAQKMLPFGSPGWLKTEDILSSLKKEKDD